MFADLFKTIAPQRENRAPFTFAPKLDQLEDRTVPSCVDGFKCVDLLNKGQLDKGNEVVVGQVCYKVEGGTLTMKTSTSGNTEIKLGLDDDTDPWSNRVAILGKNAGFKSPPLTLTPSGNQEEAAGKYEWFLENFLGADNGAGTTYVVDVQDYRYIAVHFNSWIDGQDTSIVAFLDAADVCAQELEGMSHGFWKNHLSYWAATGYSTSTTIAEAFGAGYTGAYGGPTLLEALDFTGSNDIAGAERILLRNAVASLLNAAHPNINYPLSLSDVINQVNAAIASQDRDTMLALEAYLDELNNLGGDPDN